MPTAEISIYVDAPIERTFEALADHERFFRGKRIKHCKVVRPGRDEKNGLGAIREVHNAHVRFVERITRFERPHRLDYLVTECTLPLKHEGGQVVLTPRGSGTEVRWTSRFRIAVPLVGEALGDIARMVLVDEITRLLHQARHELEGAKSSAGVADAGGSARFE